MLRVCEGEEDVMAKDKAAPDDIAGMSFEVALAELETIVRRLEEG